MQRPVAIRRRSVRVRSAQEKLQRRLRRPQLRGHMERRDLSSALLPLVGRRLRMDIGPVLQQRAHHLAPVVGGGEDQCGPLERAASSPS
ncbi:unnamed protein product, partial [Clonostachys solani]